METTVKSGNSRMTKCLLLNCLTTAVIYVSSIVQCSGSVTFTSTDEADLSGSPCIYEGHVSTTNNWFGYIANLTVLNTGRMLFEFTYSAERCCQNILFYNADQVSFINPRLTCWQKEYLLRPEDDQILRLTPRFSWSGCHISRPAGRPMYVCEGGRSFAVEQSLSAANSWYLAVSNCATRAGLDLRYRLAVYGLVGRCQYSFRVPVSPVVQFPVPIVYHSQWSGAVLTSPTTNHCTVSGFINTHDPWFGFLTNISLSRGGGFKFLFQFSLSDSLPVTSQSVSVLLYTQHDVNRITAEQSCWQKYMAIHHRYLTEQVIELSSRSSWHGCATDNVSSAESISSAEFQGHQGHHGDKVSGGHQVVTCRGERRYDDAVQWFVAVSNCRHDYIGLHVRYVLEVYGYETAEHCSTIRSHGDVTGLVVVVVAIATGLLTDKSLSIPLS